MILGHKSIKSHFLLRVEENAHGSKESGSAPISSSVEKKTRALGHWDIPASIISTA